jgi:hypothetical protein
MKHVTAALWLGLVVAAVPAAAFADDDEPQILDSSAGARSGANRLGGPTMTSPPHAWVGVGQSPEAISTDDTRKEKPRNPAVVGPPVPRQAKQLPSEAKTTAPQTSDQSQSNHSTDDE